MKKIAFYGGSFDPVHNGHLAIASALIEQFGLDSFVFIPAFHAPHKTRIFPTSPYDRYAMLCLATRDIPNARVSRIEIDTPERPYTVETQEKILETHKPNETFFVIGADSWRDITTWREWEKVLTATNIIVVTRPGVALDGSHVGDEIGKLIVSHTGEQPGTSTAIYFTDAVNMDVSATSIRKKIRENDASWKTDVPPEVAKYIEKYQIYS